MLTTRGARRLPAALAAAIFLVTGCSGDSGTVAPTGPVTPTSRVLQGASPGEDNSVVTEIPEMPDVVTEADLAFVRGMLLHHAQALEMTELVLDRATREDITLFAERIELSQAEEIGVMQDWLRGRGEPVFELGGIQAHEHPEQMSGMLTGEQMAELAGTSGADFDLLFLQSMYRHHEGAIAMVDELSDAGGAQDPFIFELAKEIDNDQRIEMDRMVGMLADLGATPPATDG